MTTLNREQAVVAGAVVRLWADADTVAGAGFLVGPGQVATCAHVVAEALGIDPRDHARPAGRVRLDFPLLTGEPVAATVERWSPQDGSGGDLAILRLADSAAAAARMPPLRRIEHATDRAFSVLGFPAGLVDGVWSTGVVAEQEALRANPGEQPIGAGFSGAPVWDAVTGAVIGMARGTQLVPIDEVLGLDPELLPCPYRGLEPFGEEHAAAFHGRDDDIVRLLEATESVPVVAVAGPSGAGKSSLIRAGLLPRLRAAGVPVLDFRAVAGTDAVAALESALDDSSGRVDPAPAGAELLVVIDQFEELAAVEPTNARLLLERIVQRAGDPGAGTRLRAVLTLRWTALDELLTPELTSTLEGGTLLIAPLDRDQLRAAILGPAALPPGLAFEQGLVDRILDDAGAEPGQLPLVESLLATLWEHRAGGYLTHRGYEEAGGVAGAVAEHAEQVIGGVAPDSADAMRRLFTALARPDTDGRFVRRPVPLGQLPTDQRALVPVLTAGRLLVVSNPSGSDVVELAHQALIEHWPRLRGWLDADRQFLAWREQLGTHRERWEVESRAETALLRGAPLAAATEWIPGRRDDLAPADAEYLHRSTARQRREVRRWRTIIAVLAVLVLGGATLAVVAVRGGNEAAAQLALTNADAIGRDAQARARDDATTATQLALAAWKADPTNPQARSALAAAYLAMQSAKIALAGVTASPTRTLAVGGDTALLVGQGVTVATGISGPAPEFRPLPDIGPENLVALSPDGRLLADAGPDGTVRTRDLTARGEPRPLRDTGGGRILQNLQFSPDGTRLAWLVPDTAGQNKLMIRDLHTDAEVPHRLGQLPADNVTVTLTVDPDVVLVRYASTVNTKSARVVQRSLPDGGTAVAYPAGSEPTPTSVVSCEPPPKPGNSTIVVSPIRGGEPRRILSEWDCRGALLSGDRGWLIERPELDDFTGNQFLVLTDLTTATVRQVWTPPLNDQQGGIVAPAPFTPAPLIRIGTVGTNSADRPAVWMAGGTSLVRLGTDAPIRWNGTAPPRTVSFANGSWLGLTADGIAVADRTGAQVSALSGVLGPKYHWSLGDSRLSIINAAPDGWVASRYSFPELRLINEFRVPVSAPTGVRHKAMIMQEAVEDGDGVLIMSDGVLSAWDANGNRRGAPVTPESTSQWYLENPRIFPRPGHPGQAAVVTPKGGIDLWDVVAGKVISRFTTVVALGSQLTFDNPGNLLGSVTTDKHVEVWDVPTGTLTGPRTPSPDGSDVLGFDPDGYLAVVGRNGNSFVQGATLIDVRQGRQSGQLAPNATPFGFDSTTGTAHLSMQGNAAPPDLPVLARTWHDRLCKVVNRPFTPGELRLLPPGTDRDPPC